MNNGNNNLINQENVKRKNRHKNRNNKKGYKRN
jgi:hypothetical protein